MQNSRRHMPVVATLGPIVSIGQHLGRHAKGAHHLLLSDGEMCPVVMEHHDGRQAFPLMPLRHQQVGRHTTPGGNVELYLAHLVAFALLRGNRPHRPTGRSRRHILQAFVHLGPRLGTPTGKVRFRRISPCSGISQLFFHLLVKERHIVHHLIAERVRFQQSRSRHA